MAGVSGEMSEEELLLGNIPTASFDARQVGDGSRALLWIWYTVSEGELSGSVVHASRFLHTHKRLLIP